MKLLFIAVIATSIFACHKDNNTVEGVWKGAQPHIETSYKYTLVNGTFLRERTHNGVLDEVIETTYEQYGDKVKVFNYQELSVREYMVTFYGLDSLNFEDITPGAPYWLSFKLYKYP